MTPEKKELLVMAEYMIGNARHIESILGKAKCNAERDLFLVKAKAWSIAAIAVRVEAMKL